MEWKWLLVFAVLATGLMAVLAVSVWANVQQQSFIASMQTQLREMSARQVQTAVQLNDLQARYNDLQWRYAQGQEQQQNDREELQRRQVQIGQLRDELGYSRANLSQTQTRLNQTQERVRNISGDIRAMEEQLNASMAWFKENAKLPEHYAWNVDILLERAMSSCVDGDTLNLGCINYLMENTDVSLRYKTDLSAGQVDHLQSIRETVKREGGDCEDYSLLYKALLNSIKAKRPNLMLKTWADGGDARFLIYPLHPGPDERYYYYPQSHAVELGRLGERYPYVICFTVNAASGHCTVALSGAQINSSDQLGLLESAPVFEPQTGQYLGLVGERYVLCRPDLGEYCPALPGRIHVVIADDDLYRVHNSGWMGYQDSYKRLEDTRAGLAADG